MVKNIHQRNPTIGVNHPMILLKDIVKSIIKEGPEEILGHSWNAKSCVGPFIIFKDDANTPHYALSYRDSDEIMFDDEAPESGVDSSSTHGGIVDILRKRFGIDVGRHDYNKAIHGRLWEIEGKLYVGTWNTMKEITSFGLSTFKDKLKEMVELEMNTGTNDIFINPFPSHTTRNDYVGKIKGDNIPFHSFGNETKSPSENDELTKKQRDIDRNLHMMSPDIKKKILQARGVTPKTAATPEWQRKAAMGIDENI